MINISPQLKAYTAPTNNRENALRLDFNERVGIPTWYDQILLQPSSLDVTLYPDKESYSDMFAEYYEISSKHMLLTNGSTQGIDLINRFLGSPGDTVLIAEYTFALYAQFAQIYGKNITTFQLPEGAFDLQVLLTSLQEIQPQMCCISNPNNPTGSIFPIKELTQIAQCTEALGIWLVIDEAYAEFSGVSFIPYIQDYPRVLVLRTFSKAFGLAGLRLGALIATEDVIDQFKIAVSPYDINLFALEYGGEALTYIKDMNEYVADTMQEGKSFLESWLLSQNIAFLSSAGNFLLVDFPQAEALMIFLSQKNILVRKRFGDVFDCAIRVTLAPKQYMQVFVAACEEFYTL